ncbi:MAG TPA: histidinol phosphate phosphatase domain-containing protein [Methanoregulaceae archaeon]|nr:histidinol phosphate phosphatase domain-containing protein [Methanoregulaceae archaeon]HOB60173.1 histidinol phosphate phosphatase domain-containing protein [Methanoregulaceae archaeon]HOH80656.1 histidinol phosphate phosphatase domain-containing protein [Methanoregulaceae archaeon]HPW10766.1 histidinol phosphate phosphatase domain-containing protein [Methanoregulaceae archaeon]HQM56858.1 histidinol phosphate phosphatase domain-containing protein [Methanoregulaceae archaeon]
MSGLYDLHTHTTLTDGEMIPIELVRRMSVLGYSIVAITDHADNTNLDFLIESVNRLKTPAELYGVRLLCGVELTHIPPPLIPCTARAAKKNGADIVIVHGESPVEPVASGTNHAACTCSDVDVLAHPGFITTKDAYEAHDRGIALEITSRGGHNRANGHVAAVARKAECIMVVNSDAHAPHDLLDKRAKFDVARGAGLKKEECAPIMDLNIDCIVFR